jgi:hypothetical protein
MVGTQPRKISGKKLDITVLMAATSSSAVLNDFLY